jgi:hypothetical protein
MQLDTSICKGKWKCSFSGIRSPVNIPPHIGDVNIQTRAKMKMNNSIGVKMSTQLLKQPLVKLLVIEVVIFGIIALLAVSLQFTYSTGLIMIGLAILLIRFSGASSSTTFAKSAFSYELQNQYLKDVRNPQLAHERLQALNDFLIIGLIPLVGGVILSLVRL